jgi:hypothetical protein
MKRNYFIPSVLAIVTLLGACGPKMENHVENQMTIGNRPQGVLVTDIAQSEKFSPVPPPDCPITILQEPPFVPPPPYDHLRFVGEFWYGSNALWTAISRDGTWEALPHNPTGYTQKVFWWREGYSAGEEPEPALTVTAERLDGEAPSVRGSKATNASASDIGSAMLVGVDLPTLGCWRITGNYGDAELSFVVLVAP